MPILDQTNPAEVKRYQAYVASSPYATATQDLAWTKVKWDWGNEAVYVERGGEIVAAMTILIKKVKGMVSVLYAPRGPVCDIKDTKLVTELMQEVHKVAKKHRAFVFTMDPEVLFDEGLEDCYSTLGYIVKNRSYHKDQLIQPRFNMMLSLKDKNADELLALFSEKTRYNIRLAGRKGVSVRHSRSDADIEIFHKLSEITAVRDKINSRGIEYFKVMRDSFDADHLRVYIAEHEGEALSAAIALYYGKKMWYIYGASSNEKRNLMPNYLMQWEMINWGLEKGCEIYDFGGVFELNKENGLYKFKEGFCREDGVTELIGELDWVYNKPLYYAFEHLLPRLRALKRKLTKR